MGVPRRKWELALDARESGTSVFETGGGRTPADLPEHHGGGTEKWMKLNALAENYWQDAQKVEKYWYGANRATKRLDWR